MTCLWRFSGRLGACAFCFVEQCRRPDRKQEGRPEERKIIRWLGHATQRALHTSISDLACDLRIRLEF